MLERIQEIVAEQLGINPEDVRPDASLIEDLGADSLDIIELLMAFSEEFDIEIPDEEVENMVTINDFMDYLRENGIE